MHPLVKLFNVFFLKYDTIYVQSIEIKYLTNQIL